MAVFNFVILSTHCMKRKGKEERTVINLVYICHHLFIVETIFVKIKWSLVNVLFIFYSEKIDNLLYQYVYVIFLNPNFS